MANNEKKLASNIEINKGDILLLFNESDAKIVRKWQHAVKPPHISDPDALSP